MNQFSDRQKKLLKVFKEIIKFLFWPSRLVSYRSLGSSRNYQKVFILTQPRSGSTFLLTSLRSHPNMVIYGEIFSRASFNRFINWFRNKFPIWFLKRHIFIGYQADIKWVGFKLFEDHLHSIESGQREALWDWLVSQQGLKVVFLVRENYLDTEVSFKLAMQSGNWRSKRNHDKYAKIKIEYEELSKRFKQREGILQRIEDKIQDLDVLKVTYESMLRDKEQTLSMIQDFLGLERQSLTTSLRKQQGRELKEVIENYDELKERFQGSEWEHFFQ